MINKPHAPLACLLRAVLFTACGLFYSAVCCAEELRLNIADTAFATQINPYNTLGLMTDPVESPYAQEDELGTDKSSFGAFLKYSREVWLRGFGLAHKTDYATLKLGVRMQKSIGTLQYWVSDDLRTANLQPDQREPQLYFSFIRSW